MAEAISRCPHPWLAAVHDSLVARALSAVAAAAEAPASQMRRGIAWALLGALRLQLVQLPPGVDPVGKYAYKMAAMRMLLQHEVSFNTSPLRAAETSNPCLCPVFVSYH